MKKCMKCGNEMPDNAVFCTACGTKQAQTSPTDRPKTVTMICSKCSGTMTVDEEHKSLFCPYCGSKELILESDTVKAEQIRSQTQKDVEFKKLEQADKVLTQQTEEKKAEEIKKRKLPVVALVFGIISLLFCVIFFMSGKVASGFISLIQTALFAFSFISGKGIVSVDFGNAFVLSAVAGWVEIIPLFISMVG